MAASKYSAITVMALYCLRRASLPVSWAAIAGAPKSKLSSISGTMLRLVIDGSFDFAAQPVARVAAALKSGGGEQDEEVRPGTDVFQDARLEVAAGDAGVINENIVAIVGQVLGNGQRPRNIGAAIADENGLLDACHGRGNAGEGKR